MSKYYIVYKHRSAHCETYVEAFHELGFKLVHGPKNTSKFSSSTSSVSISGCNVKHTYSFGGVGDMSITEIMEDVVTTKCTIYKNKRYW